MITRPVNYRPKGFTPGEWRRKKTIAGGATMATNSFSFSKTFSGGNQDIISLKYIDGIIDELSEQDIAVTRRFLNRVNTLFSKVRRLGDDPKFMSIVSLLIRNDLIKRANENIVQDERLRTCLNSYIHTRQKEVQDIATPGRRMPKKKITTNRQNKDSEETANDRNNADEGRTFDEIMHSLSDKIKSRGTK